MPTDPTQQSGLADALLARSEGRLHRFDQGGALVERLLGRGLRQYASHNGAWLHYLQWPEEESFELDDAAPAYLAAASRMRSPRVFGWGRWRGGPPVAARGPRAPTPGRGRRRVPPLRREPGPTARRTLRAEPPMESLAPLVGAEGRVPGEEAPLASRRSRRSWSSAARIPPAQPEAPTSDSLTPEPRRVRGPSGWLVRAARRESARAASVAPLERAEARLVGEPSSSSSVPRRQPPASSLLAPPEELLVEAPPETWGGSAARGSRRMGTAPRPGAAPRRAAGAPWHPTPRRSRLPRQVLPASSARTAQLRDSQAPLERAVRRPGRGEAAALPGSGARPARPRLTAPPTAYLQAIEASSGEVAALPTQRAAGRAAALAEAPTRQRLATETVGPVSRAAPRARAPEAPGSRGRRVRPADPSVPVARRRLRRVSTVEAQPAYLRPAAESAAPTTGEPAGQGPAARQSLAGRSLARHAATSQVEPLRAGREPSGRTPFVGARVAQRSPRFQSPPEPRVLARPGVESPEVAAAGPATVWQERLEAPSRLGGVSRSSVSRSGQRRAPRGGGPAPRGLEVERVVRPTPPAGAKPYAARSIASPSTTRVQRGRRRGSTPSAESAPELEALRGQTQRVASLARRLTKLIHLAEGERRASEALRQVRMAEPGEGAPSTGSGAEADSPEMNVEALRRDVFDCVVRELETIQWRREDPDAPTIWF